jgi:hypothetical protein
MPSHRRRLDFFAAFRRRNAEAVNDRAFSRAEMLAYGLRIRAAAWLHRRGYRERTAPGASFPRRGWYDFHLAPFHLLILTPHNRFILFDFYFRLPPHSPGAIPCGTFAFFCDVVRAWESDGARGH